MSSEEKFDAIVVGGGLAGSAAALTMARAGLDVMLLERGKFCGAKKRQRWPALWTQPGKTHSELCSRSTVRT